MATYINLGGVSLLDLAASKSALDTVSDPETKFKIFDQLTNTGLTSTAFKVLKLIGEDPKIAPYASNLKLGSMGSIYLEKINEVLEKSKQLSEYMLSSIGDGKSRLQSICNTPETYIDSKVFHALHSVLYSKNFSAIANPNHVLHPLWKKIWNYQANNHGQFCPCYNHIQSQLNNNTIYQK